MAQLKAGTMIDGRDILQEIDDLANKARGGGALVNLNTTQLIPNESYTKVSFNNVIYDTDGFYNNNLPTRLTVPSGVSKVKVIANIEWGQTGTGRRVVEIWKNGVDGNHGLPKDSRAGSADPSVNLSSSVIEVAQGDYFEVLVFHNGGLNMSIQGSHSTWFSIEVIE